MKLSLRVMVYDATQTGRKNKFLSSFWAAGSRLGNFDHVIAAMDWSQVCDELKLITEQARLSGQRVGHLQFWGHGYSGQFLINNKQMSVYPIADALGRGLIGQVRGPLEVWFRSCDTFRGEDGQAFAKRASRALEATVVGHTRIVSAPNPICQSGGYALMKDQEPWWDKEDRGGSGLFFPNTCFVTTMNVPDGWYKRH